MDNDHQHQTAAEAAQAGFVVNENDNLLSHDTLSATVGGDENLRQIMEELHVDSERFLKNETENGDPIVQRWDSWDDFSAGLPASLIITNLPPSLFKIDTIRNEFETVFSAFDPDVTFQYFKSFKRCRANFSTPLKATLARLHCNELEFYGVLIKCYFAQITEQREEDDDHNLLKLPQLEKQFLISPPASPPVGWEPSREEDPIINLELLSRLATMAGQSEGTHELYPRNESCPAIVVHTCGDDPEENNMKPKIPQTKRPDYILSN